MNRKETHEIPEPSAKETVYIVTEQKKGCRNNPDCGGETVYQLCGAAPVPCGLFWVTISASETAKGTVYNVTETRTAAARRVLCRLCGAAPVQYVSFWVTH